MDLGVLSDRESALSVWKLLPTRVYPATKQLRGVAERNSADWDLLPFHQKTYEVV